MRRAPARPSCSQAERPHARPTRSPPPPSPTGAAPRSGSATNASCRVDDPRSNARLAREALLDRLATPPTMHAVRTELPREEAAAAYDRELRGARLDFALLGLGPDGHTASLFPDAPALDERLRLAVAADPGFEPWVDRVTLTLPGADRTRARRLHGRRGNGKPRPLAVRLPSSPRHRCRPASCGLRPEGRRRFSTARPLRSSTDARQ